MGNFFDWLPVICAIFAGVVTTLSFIFTCIKNNTHFDSFIGMVIMLFSILGCVVGLGMSILFEPLYNDYISQKNGSIPVVESSIDNDSISTIESSTEGEIYEQLEILIANGYSLYLNGESIDTKDFNIYDYPEENYYINDERKEIYLKN